MGFDIEKFRACILILPEEAQDAMKLALDEVRRQQVLNPFSANVQMAIRIKDNHFAYSDREGSAILQNLLLEHATRIRELEEHEKQTHEILGSILGEDDSLEEVAKRAMRRVTNLEGWLVEEEARFQYYVQNENCESWPEARRKYPDLEKKYIGIARQQLISEGKLKPDGTPAQPAKMSPGQTVLTKKQQEALDAIRDLVTAEVRSDYIDNSVDVLDALLSSPPGWEVTEERIEALTTLVSLCASYCTKKLEECEKYPEDVLQDMLDEVEHV